MKFTNKLSNVLARVLPQKESNTQSEQEIGYFLADIRAKVFFGLLFIIVGALLFWCLQVYFNAIVLATLTAAILYPLYRRLERKTHWSPRILTPLIMLGLGICVAVPLLFIGKSLFSQVVAAQQSLSHFISSGGAAALQTKIQTTAQHIGITVSPHTSQSLLDSILSSLNQSLLSLTTKVVTSVSSLVVATSVYVFLLFYLLPRMSRFKLFLEEVSPLGKEITKSYLDRVYLLLRGTILGTFLVSVTAATIMGTAFWALGIPNAALFASLALILGCIPYLGTYLFTVPVIAYFVIVGDYANALFLTGLQLLVLNQVDLIFRPIALPKKIRMHPSINIIAIMSGLATFGLIGIIYGPLIFILFIASIQIYRQNFVETKS